MTFLPIVARELRVAARRRVSHGARLVAALGAILVGGWIMLVPHMAAPQRLGITLFVWLSILAFVYCLFAGLFTTSDCLSHEKREGTFGLLFLTDLKGYDIVLGKLAATSLNAFYGLLAIFPVMAISLLAGGVTVDELVRVVLALLNALFLSLTTGMFFSAICRDERKSALFTTLALLGVTCGGPLLGAITAAVNNARSLRPEFFVFSPGYTFFMAFEETRRGLKPFNFYPASLAIVNGLSWLLLISACFIVPRIWRDKTEFAGKRSKVEKPPNAQWVLWQQFQSRAWRLEINPIFWLTSRDRLRPVLIWSFFGLVALAWLWGWAEFPNDWAEEPVFLMTALSVHSVLKLWMAAAASRRFNDDHHSGALELLLVTPLTVREIVRGHLKALKSHFLAPVLVVVGVDCAFMAGGSRNDEWVTVCLAGITMFVLDMFTLAWVGTWLGLKSKSAIKAIGAAIARILVLPWLLLFLVMTMFALMGPRSLPNDDEFVVGLWFVLGVAVNLVFGIRAARGLKHEFRRVAARRFEPSQPRRWRPFARSGAQPAAGR